MGARQRRRDDRRTVRRDLAAGEKTANGSYYLHFPEQVAGKALAVTPWEKFEPLYLVTAGHGLLRIGDEEREVATGDCAAIPPGTVHQLRNPGPGELVVVCACSPPYSHEDTVLA